MYHISDTGDH